MAVISSETVKLLRDKTGAGMMDCKRALEESNGDIELATENLRKKGAAVAAKRAEREANQGVVEAYIHAGGRIGAMVELNCETDFVAKTPEFKQLAHDLAMQIAAMSPLFVSKEDVDQQTLQKEIEIYKAQAVNEGKPAEIAEKIATGRLEKYYQEVCLLEQSFIKDSGKTIKDLLSEATGKVGEKIGIRRFHRYHLGEATH
ncbi:MAG TPA: translation elongation factor Ts [Bacteroidetes bacterium]|nr:MAG: translation elongation factor Ts [Ignavibacteria bacterium GWA2_54_16]HCA80282.1 translation elongation factor Ts [Bacteroidota bacterium]